MEILDQVKATGDKLKALELAESSRESEWKFPSFAAELFKGQLRWDLILPYPVQSAEEKKIGDDLLVKVEKVLKTHINPDEVDRTGELPKEALKAMADLGLFAMKIPKSYGGRALSPNN